VEVRCLSVHAGYACAHAGACCTAGWTIPVEARLVQPLRAAGIHIGADRVAPARDGACVFFEAGSTRLCTIHRVAGAALLPSVCRHFPRVIVNDPRGTSVTLSHFCPTAAALLFDSGPLAIVNAPATIALDGVLEGLDATNVLPPLLAAGVLTDWAGYSTWEQCAVALFNDGNFAPEQAVGLLSRATTEVCSWKPGGEPMAAAVERAFAAARARRISNDDAAFDWGGFDGAVNRFLAAHAFASWAPYEPRGLRAIPAAVAQALALLTQELSSRGIATRENLLAAIRATDLRLRHGNDERRTTNREPERRTLEP
jgi:Fe-S-cluster containining protein